MRLSGNQKKSHIVCLGLSQKSITIFLILKDVKCVISVGYLKNYWLSWPFKQLFRESIFLECGSIDHFVVCPFKNFYPAKIHSRVLFVRTYIYLSIGLTFGSRDPKVLPKFKPLTTPSRCKLRGGKCLAWHWRLQRFTK